MTVRREVRVIVIRRVKSMAAWYHVRSKGIMRLYLSFWGVVFALHAAHGT